MRDEAGSFVACRRRCRRVLIVRGQLATPWELRPWAELPDRFDVSYLLTRSNEFDAGSAAPARASR